jgi:type I restriction-modification system DNA methylase subunit
LPASLASFKIAAENLIRRFQSDRIHYLSKSYSEAQARVDFITPFFKALGWDTENEAALPHHSRDVVVEATDDTTGRPDYSFRVAGQTRFFVEAKAPSEELDAARHIIQAKSYAWNTKQVFFVVLTDFEEFRFYDASIQPDERRPEEGLLLKLKYTDYLKNAEKLWEFSRERVVAGSLEALLPRDRRTQRLRIPVDEAFLDEMTGWREDLAKNIYKRNPTLTAKQLNEVVQRLLDRIVFIRIAEDRRVIEKNQLRDVVEEWKARGDKLHIFDWLNDLFHRINEDFNGEIFKPHLSEEIKIDSDVLAHIIERLYPPKSPYRFDVMGVELLGSIYERYLGKTIRPTAKQVRVEEKPEVRKAGGVYYTAKYIVDYIVKNTVGKIIEGKTPKQIEKLRILDPACGSGSFLIGAFQCLIDYHVRYLTEHPKEAQGHALFPDIVRDENGEPRLSVVRKAEILKNNLFGVDIDPQAVEITMMSLYLKALEGERSQLPPKQHLLPELKYNIICGNSLIGPEIYGQASLFGDAERDRINAFAWNSDVAGFGRIMKDGGFDCVIGNPPYVRIQHMKEWAPVEVEFYKKHFHAASAGNYDIYVVFIEKGLAVLGPKGKLGFIVPHKFFNSKYGEPLRGLLSGGKHVSRVVHFGAQQIFEDATNYTCLLFLDKAPSMIIEFEKAEDLSAWRERGAAKKGSIPATRINRAEWNFTVGAGAEIFERLSKMAVTLGDVADVFVGLQTSADDVFILERVEERARTLVLRSRSLGDTVILEKDLLFPLVSGTDVHRYDPLPTRQVIIFPYHVENEQATLIPLDQIEALQPKTARYLRRNKDRLENREEGKFQGKDWHRFGRSQNLGIQGRPKLCVPRLVDHLYAAYDETGTHFLDNVDVGGLTLRVESNGFSIKYLLALLNSSTLRWYFPLVSAPFRGGWLSANRQFLSQLPIPVIDFARSQEKAHHDRIVALAEQMIDLSARKKSGTLAPSQLRRLEREIAATDSEIDHLIYKLYSITDEERIIIEAREHE